MVAHLLGNVNQKLMDTYHEYCPFVEVKEFNYSKYPKYFKRLTEYRWKPLIVAEYLAEYDVVFWFDTSIVFRKDNETLKVRLY